MNSSRVADKKHARSLKRLNIKTKQNQVNTVIQIRKQKLQTNKEARQTIGAIDVVPHLSFLRDEQPFSRCSLE